MARYPYERVNALLADKPSQTKTPTTLSGNSNAIYSYAKKIAWKDESGQWFVVDRQSSRTTNRHIDAVARTLGWRGLNPITVDYWTEQPV